MSPLNSFRDDPLVASEVVMVISRHVGPVGCPKSVARVVRAAVSDLHHTGILVRHDHISLRQPRAVRVRGISSEWLFGHASVAVGADAVGCVRHAGDLPGATLVVPGVGCFPARFLVRERNSTGLPVPGDDILTGSDPGRSEKRRR